MPNEPVAHVPHAPTEIEKLATEPAQTEPVPEDFDETSEAEPGYEDEDAKPLDEKPPTQVLQQTQRAELGEDLLGKLAEKVKVDNGVRILNPQIYTPSGSKERLHILVGPPGDGGAPHDYAVQFKPFDGPPQQHLIAFQKGLPSEVGTTGLTNEALLAIVADRLEGFQQGPFACSENGFALSFVRDALTALHTRTANRLKRGVESSYVE